MRSWYSIWLTSKKLQQILREASERKPATSSITNSVNKHFATRSIVQKRLSIYNWNPGPRRGKRRCLRKNKLQGGGISLPCRRRPNMLIMTFLQVDSTGPITQVARFSSIRTPSTPTSMSSPSTFMTQGETCQIKSCKGNRDGSCKVFFHVPHFVGHR